MKRFFAWLKKPVPPRLIPPRITAGIFLATKRLALISPQWGLAIPNPERDLMPGGLISPHSDLLERDPDERYLRMKHPQAEDEIWLAKTIRGLKPGDVLVLTEGTPAAWASGHYIDMARGIQHEINKHVQGITTVVCTRGNSLDKLREKDRDMIVEAWAQGLEKVEDGEIAKAAEHLLRLVKRKKVADALDF